jgi:hypothetical protein
MHERKLAPEALHLCLQQAVKIYHLSNPERTASATPQDRLLPGAQGPGLLTKDARDPYRVSGVQSAK